MREPYLEHSIEHSDLERCIEDGDESSAMPLQREDPWPKYLQPECTATANGKGPVIHIADGSSRLLVVTLGITSVIEQESIVVSISGSADDRDWGAGPLVTFPAKNYCGMYSVLLNLAKCPAVRHLRVEWNIRRWGKRDALPLFGFLVSVDESGSRFTRSSRIPTLAQYAIAAG